MSDERRLLMAMRMMDPRELEHLVARLWQHRGFDTEVSPPGADQGLDVRAERPIFDREGDQIGNEINLIQVKRYGRDSKVSSPDVQQYASLRYPNPTMKTVYVVTTGEFTGNAREMASRHDVELVNGPGLASQVLFAGLADSVPYFEPDVDDTSTAQAESDQTQPVSVATDNDNDNVGSSDSITLWLVGLWLIVQGVRLIIGFMILSSIILGVGGIFVVAPSLVIIGAPLVEIVGFLVGSAINLLISYLLIRVYRWVKWLLRSEEDENTGGAGVYVEREE